MVFVKIGKTRFFGNLENRDISDIISNVLTVRIRLTL